MNLSRGTSLLILHLLRSRLHCDDHQLQQISKCIFQYEYSIDELIHPGHSQILVICYNAKGKRKIGCYDAYFACRYNKRWFQWLGPDFIYWITMANKTLHGMSMSQGKGMTSTTFHHYRIIQCRLLLTYNKFIPILIARENANVRLSRWCVAHKKG